MTIHQRITALERSSQTANKRPKLMYLLGDTRDDYPSSEQDAADKYNAEHGTSHPVDYFDYICIEIVDTIEARR